MIIFEKIRWKNILSTGNAWTEVLLNRSSNTLIVGENGSGKSTILDALCYVLFSKPFRKVSKKQLVNSVNQKGASIECEFSIGKNHYKVHRTIKTYGSQPFEIYINDKLVDQTGDSRDYQDFLETNILKLNFKSFTQIVILGSSSFIPFMQLTSPQRKEIIEDLLDIKIFSAMNLLLKDKVTDNKNKVQELKYQVKLTEEKINVQKKFIDEIRKSQSDKIDANDNEIKKAKDNIQRHKARIDTLQSQIEELQESVKDHDKLQKKLGKVSVIESSLETKIKRLKDDILFYETNDQCPTCSQSLTAEFKKKAIEGKNSKLSEAVKGMEELGNEYEKIKTQVSEMSNVNGLVTSKQSLISSEHGNINAMNNYIEKLGDENKNISNDRKDIGKENKKLSTLVTSLANQNKSQEELTNDKQMYEVAAMMLRDQGIKTKIIKQYVPIMNKLINKYLAAMDFFVDFQLDENFVEVIKSRHRDEFTYDSFSEGEKMRIDLALLCTWRAIARMKNSTNTNLLILDEVFDASLDNNGCDEFLKILHQLGNDQNVFVISHKGDILSDKFRSTIRFEKHKNFSRIAS